MNFPKLLSLILTASTAVILASCSQKIDETELSLSLPVKSVKSESGSQLIRVTATGDWTLELQYSDEGGWASVDQQSGTDSQSGILFVWGTNSSEDERICTLVLKKGSRTAEAVFKQNGYVQVTGVGPGAEKLVSEPVPGWMELPATNSKDLYFITHDMLLGAQKIRNYSFYYDTKALVAHWVAYPLNYSLMSSGKRTDAWGLDPKVPRDLQPVILSTFRSPEDGMGYDRGHQLPSADRYLLGANEATFYGTNMTPQHHDLNAEPWAFLENLVRDWSSLCDTLYVVTGADIQGSTKFAYDNDGKKVTVPTGYFKALLAKIKTADVADAYKGIAFYMDHNKSYDKRDSNKESVMATSMSIRDLEKKVKTDFFVNLPKAVDYADKVETTVDKWWTDTAK